ncbi:transcriptional repressor rco-1 [Coccidioides immitis RMSCC 3703]|uniref:Transcriptional repressor rco-1 n=1 Tax=Coccidioides immitis RMSCC 3703 TaxID=454286 RepID=A0A0J8QPH5_COCIT|nr:transcriptional repressor rco-1 [Coccidioides immitis RMSCC 3703]
MKLPAVLLTHYSPAINPIPFHSSHRSNIARIDLSPNGKLLLSIYTVSKDGALFRWQYGDKPGEPESTSESPILHWRITKKDYFMQQNAKLTCSAFHPKTNLLVVGFSNGIFALYELPEFNQLHLLSVSQSNIDYVTVNNSGEWLALGSAKLGQLLVWEWQSESYILKQQGHLNSMNSLVYSPDGQKIITAADDGKIKVWDINSGFCVVTFTEHTAAVTACEFTKQGNVLFTASLDGSVRAWDLIRYRNFRTFTAPSRQQFSSLAVDPSGEVVCAGSLDSFDIHVWSVQTGQLLDRLAGHEGPVSSLSFAADGSHLVSGSWDRTVRLWNIFARSQTNAIQQAGIDGRRDISGGRKITDRRTAANAAGTKTFTTITYSADGSCLLAAGNSKYICLYDVGTGSLVKKFTVSVNTSIDGTMEFLNSKNMTEAGPRALIDETGEASDLEDRIDRTLPGAKRGDAGARNTRPEIRVTSARFSPTGRSFCASSTEGLLVYSLDTDLVFDPLQILTFPSLQIASSPLSQRQKFNLLWIRALLSIHGRYIKDNSGSFATELRAVQRAVDGIRDDLKRVVDKNMYALDYLLEGPAISTSNSADAVQRTTNGARKAADGDDIVTMDDAGKGSDGEGEWMGIED